MDVPVRQRPHAPRAVVSWRAVEQVVDVPAQLRVLSSFAAVSGKECGTGGGFSRFSVWMLVLVHVQLLDPATLGRRLLRWKLRRSVFKGCV